MDCAHTTRLLALTLVTAVSFWGPPTHAEEEVYAIQNRIFDRHHEVDLLAGFIPNDDFHDPMTLGVQYTYNFNEILAWEVVRAQYFFNREKDLKRDLEENFGVTPTELDWLQYAGYTSLVLKPSYGKDALWNHEVVNHETCLVAGAGVVRYESENSDGETGGETAPSLNFGLGRKYFISENLCLNLEVRDYLTFREGGVENRVYLGLSLGFRFDLAPRKPAHDDSAQRLRGYIGKGGRDG